jgi:hypothetical protein
MTAFFIIFTDTQGFPQSLIIFKLGFGEIVDLMGLESFGVRTEVFAVYSFLIELATQSLALIIDFVLSNTAMG